MGQVISAATPTIIEAIKGCLGLNESVQDLETQVNHLTNKLADLQTKLTNLERGGKRRRTQEVVSLIEQATKLTKDFPTLKERTIQGQWWEKYLSIDGVKKMREAVGNARIELTNIGELTIDVDDSTIPSLVVSQLSGKTSNDNLEKLYGYLDGDKVSSIGVYGMGGVGKTTVVKHIHNQILQKMSGVKVYWVTVSQDFSIKKLQDDIAKKIGGLEFVDEDDEDRRAAILHQHLVGRKTVLILDDVWKCIPLEKLGVPLRVKDCKLILTTRSRDVCHMIGCQKLFQVNVLNEEEGWNLFKEILVLQNDHIVLTEDIEKYAKELAKKCGGLPLAVNVVAASMRGVNDGPSWRNAIKNFQRLEEFENNVFEILEFSYNRLNDQRMKECFLYCCLYPEDHMIDVHKLIMMFIAEGLCEDRDEGYFILNKLVGVFLLEEGEEFSEDGYVKVHDLMREMGLGISKFMVKSRLIEIPEERHWIPELERVSFMNCQIEEIPDGFSPRSHNLSTLIIMDSYYRQLQRISESFLLYMTRLRVLDLSDNKKLECLPNSISNLENLCGLFLQHCECISCLPAMEKLRALRVLNIEGCKGIRELPQDMKYLVSLQYLYMKYTDILIPTGVISKLRNLRCLQLEYCPNLQSEEVNCLPHLQEFTNCYDELQSFNTTLVKKLEQLKGYHIWVGKEGYCYNQVSMGERNVYFKGINFKGERAAGQEITVLLPANICVLLIEECEGLNGCIADYFQSMSNLRHLIVYKCKGVEWILNSEQITEHAASNTSVTPPFKSLEVLELCSLRNLISVCKGEDVILPDCTFSLLTHLFITNCPVIKKLLPQVLLQNLKNLETLEVERCRNLEVVIGEVGDEEGIGSNSNSPLLSSSNILYLSNLKDLILENLPALKSICNGREMICPSIEKISIRSCRNVKRMPSFLPINEATEQPYIPSSFRNIKLFECDKKWWESLEWHNPNTKHILQPQIEWSHGYYY